jgi:hypothetical protein
MTTTIDELLEIYKKENSYKTAWVAFARKLLEAGI